MAFLFRSRSKPEVQLPKVLAELIPRAWGASHSQKAEDDLVKALVQMKNHLQGTQETEPEPRMQDHLLMGILDEDVLYPLAANMERLPYDAQRNVQLLFNYLLRWKAPLSQTAGFPDGVIYLTTKRPEALIDICRGCGTRATYMTCNSIIRDALKFEDITATILYDEPTAPTDRLRVLSDIDPDEPQSGSGIFWQFFTWIDTTTFEISTDVAKTFREILTTHKKLVAHYLIINFDLFFEKFSTVLMQSDSYVTQRQSLQLLGEILLDRANYRVMTAYVDQGEHLKRVMNLLKDSRNMIKYEAFHVFKVFVANPNKSIEVQKILLLNREKLLRFLPSFLKERTEDDQFNDEKSFLIRQIQTMPSEPVPPTVQQGPS